MDNEEGSDKDKNVVCAIVGDGAFNYTPIAASFGFAQQYKTPILCIVANNNGFVSQGWNVFKVHYIVIVYYIVIYY